MCNEIGVLGGQELLLETWGQEVKVLRSKPKSLPILRRTVGRGWQHACGEEASRVTSLRLCVGRSRCPGGQLCIALPVPVKPQGGRGTGYQ